MQIDTLTNFVSSLDLNKGKLNISKLSAGLLDGSISGSAVINSNGNWSKTLRIKQIPFEKLAAEYMDNMSMTGATNGSISLRSNGKSIHDWVQAFIRWR